MMTRAVGRWLLALAALWIGGCGEDTGRGTGGVQTDSSSGGADSQNQDSEEPDTAEPDTTEPDTTEPDTAEPDTAEPDTAEPDTTEPDTAEPDTAEPDTTEPLPEPQDPGPETPATQGDVTLNDRGFLPDLKGTVCTPTTGTAPYPLVVISPGFGMDRDQYKSYCEHLASWGFVAVVQTYQGITHTDFADSVGEIIDWALDPSSGLSIDPDKIATAGHSLGGKVSILAAIRDARVKAVVGWDPVDTGLPSVAPDQMNTLSVPLALLGETLDAVAAFPPAPACAPAADNYTAYFNAASSRPVLAYTVLEADHMDWVDDPSCFLCGACRPGEADHNAVKALTRRTTVAFLRRHLLGDVAMDTYLTGEVALFDETAGVWTIQSR